MRKVQNATMSGLTVGRRTIKNSVEIAILWEDDAIGWYPESEVTAILAV
ncbi:hypothetical protein OV320_7845 [Actinobacteria bacterium OV320]|jgi:hypothetical protein|nr:hypothetical protein OV320_7845 [Actinobacteria bacterium OV320]